MVRSERRSGTNARIGASGSHRLVTGGDGTRFGRAAAMARPTRRAPANYVFHALNRGNQRQRIFDDGTDYQMFLRLLAEASRRFRMRVIAYCLMPNHWHLVVWPRTDDALSAFIHWLCGRHAALYRKRSATVGAGHLYQDRFKSFPVQTGSYYLNAVRYVEGNALRAGLASRCADWVWSSAFERTSGEIEIISPGPLALPSNWSRLVDASLPAATLQKLRVSAARERPYGDEQWTRDAADALGLERSLRGPGRPPTHAAAAARLFE